MSEFSAVNLKPYLNHKFIYGKSPDLKHIKTEIGLDNTYVVKRDLNIKNSCVFNGIEFEFSFGKNDNVVCERQCIEINSEAIALHFIAFAYWGDTNEYVKVLYENSEEDFKVPFIDLSHKIDNSFFNSTWYGTSVSEALQAVSSGELKQPVFFHHSKIATNRKKIKAIVLPDNMFVHIFAITLEK